MRRRVLVAVLVLAAFATEIACVQLIRLTSEVVPGVWRAPIPLGRSLMHYTLESQQPFRTITLDCPGVDSIRLWPLPPVWPWFEDGYEQPAPNPRGKQLGIHPPSTRRLK